MGRKAAVNFTVNELGEQIWNLGPVSAIELMSVLGDALKENPGKISDIAKKLKVMPFVARKVKGFVAELNKVLETGDCK